MIFNNAILFIWLQNILFNDIFGSKLPLKSISFCNINV